VQIGNLRILWGHRVGFSERWIRMLMDLIPALAVLSASASYIAAPAAMRLSLPESNPTLYLTSSLAITFPFNITIGLPLYFELARKLCPATP